MKRDTTTIQVNNLFNSQGVVLSAEDMQNIVNYAIKNEIVKVSILENDICNDGVGEIDIDYPDEIGLLVHNPIKRKMIFDIADFSHKIREKNASSMDYEIKAINEEIRNNDINIKAGERVAQIKLMEHKNFLMPNEYRTDEARNGGFGSTN